MSLQEQSTSVDKATEHFRKILNEQIARVNRLSEPVEWVDYTKLRRIIVGVAGGDGIGPIISKETIRILQSLVKDEIDSGKIELKEIGGLTIENRIKVLKPIPEDVLEEFRQCHVLLKGPTTTPEMGDGMPNIESANVALRKVFDLFANVRPVRVPRQGIDWVFFRENTEGEYVLGSQGLMVTPKMAFDFKVITKPGSQRIIRAAFNHAKMTGRKRVTVVTKANVIKTTDGLFLETAKEISKEFPEIQMDAWYIDAFTAKLIDEKRRTDFQVVVLPNLYGDIVTDEAAEFQGGVGTAGSANIGARYAMFEAIHGSAPRMIREGRGIYADPLSMLRATEMMLEHIGLLEKSKKLARALDICAQYEPKLKITGRPGGATTKEFADYVISTMNDPRLESRWRSFQRA